MSLLALNTVEIGFVNNPLTRPVTLSLRALERLVVVGPSGSGKSVFLKTVAGLIPPLSGQLRVFEQLRPLDSTIGADGLRIGMLFQKNALFDSLSVLSNVAFPMIEVMQMEAQRAYQEAEHLLDSVGLLSAKHLFPAELSGGMQKRLGIARALAARPELILYDDPTAGLDPVTSRAIVKLILSAQAEHKSTVIVVTNDMNRAYELATHVLFLGPGTHFFGTPDELRKHSHPMIDQFIHGKTTGPLKSSSEEET